MRPTFLLTLSAAAGVAVAVPLTARADEPVRAEVPIAATTANLTPMSGGPATPRFGDRSTVVLSSDLAGFVGAQASRSSAMTGVISLAPAVDWFAVARLSFGLQGTLHFDDTDLGKHTTFGVGPRVGYDVPIGPSASLWLRVDAQYLVDDFKPSPAVPSTTSGDLQLRAFAPVLWHPVRHFFLGAGPVAYRRETLTGSAASYTAVGVMFTVGGWL